jgi:two-component system sensor histidine kinase UhpB
MPLVWRVFLGNALVLLAACCALLLTPVTVSSPVAAQEAITIGAGLLVMLLIDLALLRRAFTPLESLARRMEHVDLLRPGLRAEERADHEVAVLTEAFNAMLERLEDERRGGAERAVVALEDERRRVARDLHDQVGQALTGVLLQIDRAARGVDGAPRAGLEDAREAARTALEDVRHIAQQLRPEVLDDLGLASALRSLAAAMGRASGIRIVCVIERELPPLTPETELVVYRVAQESLTNVVRHAGATRAELRLTATRGRVALTVRDDGHGLDPGDVGNDGGIRGMRERALLVGADLRVTVPGEGGTLVALEVPPA